VATLSPFITLLIFVSLSNLIGAQLLRDRIKHSVIFAFFGHMLVFWSVALLTNYGFDREIETILLLIMAQTLFTSDVLYNERPLHSDVVNSILVTTIHVSIGILLFMPL